MAEDGHDTTPPRNRNEKTRKPYAPPKIIFSELTHSSTEGPGTPPGFKGHGNHPGDVSHTDSTEATS